MSEFVRSVIAELNRFVGRAHFSSRRIARLPLTVSLVNQHSSMAGTTCDLSKTGISFIVSSIHLGASHLFCGNQPDLEIRIQLPGGFVQMKAMTVRYDVSSVGEQGYLIGARIMGMSENDRARYYKFLHTSAQKILKPPVLSHG